MLPEERVAKCLRCRIASGVQVLRHPELEAAWYGGLMTCGSVWNCPLCSAKISERRREELGRAVRAGQERVGQVVLVTYTISHQRRDELKESVDGLIRARELSRSGGWGRRFRERYGLAGSVRALEVTHGQNGWHPHLHELLFVRSGVDPERLGAELLARWAGMVGRVGLPDVNEHGVDVRLADLTVAEYVAKFGHERTWDVQHELAKAVSKRGRKKSRSPIGLLEAYCDGDRAAGMLFRHYAEVFKGRRQLVWSRGLRELLGLAEEQSDAEIAADVREFSVLLTLLGAWEWEQVLRSDLRGELVQAAASRDVAGFWRLLGAIRIAGGRPAERQSDEA